MATPVERAWHAGLREARAHNLAEYPAQAHAWATAVLAHWGYSEPDRPDIVSGYRSPVRQRELLARWSAGNRAGLVARPATRSWHTVGRAIDVQHGVRGFPAYAWLLTSYTGARDGRSFGDPGHFDWPTADRPPSII